MSFSYSGDPSKSNKDQVRFLLRDMAAPGTLSDEEIFFLLDTYGDPVSAAINGARTISGNYAGLVDRTVGPLSIKYGELAKRYDDLGDMLLSSRARGGSSKAYGVRAITTQKSQAPYFTLGMHDIYKEISAETSLIDALLMPSEEELAAQSTGQELIAYAGAPYSMLFEYKKADGTFQDTSLFRARAQLAGHDTLPAILIDVLSTTPGSGLVKTDPGVISWTLSAAQTTGKPYWCVFEVQLEEIANLNNRLPIASGTLLFRPQVIPDA